jgi:polyphosphate glucokinase
MIAGETEPRKFPAGPKVTPRQLASGVRKLSEDWKYDGVSIGYPGRGFFSGNRTAAGKAARA